jgi:hypothetical protein
VPDALTIWPEVSLSGQLGALELIDGTTIRPLLDFRGRIAPPPAPAYIQMLHGMPTSYFTRDRLIYRPLNTAVNTPYGASPMEWFLLTVNLAMRREVFHVSSFTEGNVPEALVGAPASWTQDQIDIWQKYWDAMVAGNVSMLRRMHWVPLEGSRSGLPVYEFRKDDLGVTERDKWLMQVACWAFGNSPAEFGIMPGEGLGGKGYSQGMENVQYRSMIGPITQHLQRLFCYVIKRWIGKPHLGFIWVGLEPQEDRLSQSQVDTAYIASGVYTVGYVQDRLGIPKEFRPDPEQFAAQQNAFPGLVPTVNPVTLPPGVGAAKFFRQKYP